MNVWAEFCCKLLSPVSFCSCTKKPRFVAGAWFRSGSRALSDRDVFAEIDVLDGVEELSAFFDWTLECLATGDEALSARALVDDGGLHGFSEVVAA